LRRFQFGGVCAQYEWINVRQPFGKNGTKTQCTVNKETNMQFTIDRRGALASIGTGLMMSGLAQVAPSNAETDLEPPGAKNLRDLSRDLAAMPRRRDFITVPMILDNPELWDAAPLNAVLAYKGGPRHAWDHTDLLVRG
jgi:hypothetical protein